MNKRKITEHEKEAYKRARELYYRQDPWGPINAKNEDTLTCWVYMRIVYYGYKTLKYNQPIPETLEKLVEWEEKNKI